MPISLTYVVDGNKTITVRFPTNTEPRLGRDPAQCDLVLHDPGVSRTHALLRRVDAGYALRDLDSTKGTLVNGAPARPEVPVQSGDIIEIGPFVLMIDVGKDEGAVADKTFKMQLQRCPNPSCNAYVLAEFKNCMTCGASLS